MIAKRETGALATDETILTNVHHFGVWYSWSVDDVR